MMTLDKFFEITFPILSIHMSVYVYIGTHTHTIYKIIHIRFVFSDSMRVQRVRMH